MPRRSQPVKTKLGMGWLVLAAAGCGLEAPLPPSASLPPWQDQRVELIPYQLRIDDPLDEVQCDERVTYYQANGGATHYCQVGVLWLRVDFAPDTDTRLGDRTRSASDPGRWVDLPGDVHCGDEPERSYASRLRVRRGGSINVYHFVCDRTAQREWSRRHPGTRPEADTRFAVRVLRAAFLTRAFVRKELEALAPTERSILSSNLFREELAQPRPVCRPRASRTFNAAYPLKVLLLRGNHDRQLGSEGELELTQVGITPSLNGVAIPESAAWLVAPLDGRFSDVELPCLVRELAPRSVPGLSLAGSSITDAGLAHLEALAGLQHLSLKGTQVSDAGIRRLAKLSALITLDLRGTRVSNAGLLELAKLTRLRRLDLAHTAVDDAGLTSLRLLKDLRLLCLASTQVSDAGVRHLLELATLEEVDLTASRVSKAGAMKLRRSGKRVRRGRP